MKIEIGERWQLVGMESLNIPDRGNRQGEKVFQGMETVASAGHSRVLPGILRLIHVYCEYLGHICSVRKQLEIFQIPYELIRTLFPNNDGCSCLEIAPISSSVIAFDDLSRQFLNLLNNAIQTAFY
jgi:hypothetical protein